MEVAPPSKLLTRVRKSTFNISSEHFPDNPDTFCRSSGHFSDHPGIFQIIPTLFRTNIYFADNQTPIYKIQLQLQLLVACCEAKSLSVKIVPHIWMQRNIQTSEKYPNIQLERRTADTVGQYLARPRSTLI